MRRRGPDFAALYAAFNDRDIDTAIAAMHPDVEWPNGWEGGWLRGREEVRAYVAHDTLATHVYTTDADGLVTRMDIV